MLDLCRKDQEILQYLFCHKVASISQIERDLFQNMTKRYAYKRLKELRSKKAIEVRNNDCGMKLQYVYQVTDLGLKSFLEFFPYEIDRPVLKSDAPSHDLILLDIISRLKKLEYVDRVLTENVLRSCSELEKDTSTRDFVWLRSDAMLGLKSPSLSTRVAFEFDRTEKSRSRYEEKLRNYYLHDNVPAVFFVFEDRAAISRLMTIDKQVCQNKKPKFYFSTLENVMKDQKELSFTNHIGGQVILK